MSNGAPASLGRAGSSVGFVGASSLQSLPMDANCFDGLSRSLSRKHTRHRVTCLLGGLSLGGVLTTLLLTSVLGNAQTFNCARGIPRAQWFATNGHDQIVDDGGFLPTPPGRES